MSEKRRGLGRGLGALIPSGPVTPRSTPDRAPQARPVDVFFDQRLDVPDAEQETRAPEGAGRSVFMARTGAGTGRRVPVPAFPADERDEQQTLDVAPDDEAGATPGAVDEGADDSGPGAAPAPSAEARAEASTQVTAHAGTPHPEPVSEPPAEPVVTPETGESQDTAPDHRTGGLPGTGERAVVDAGDIRPLPPEQPVVDVPGEDGNGLVPVPGARFLEIPVTSIVPNTRQPRTVFDEDELAELVHSVQTVGVLQPVVVRPLPGVDAASAEGPAYELVMGERRWRAATEAGLGVVPAIVRDTTDDDLLRDALLENLHRSQLNPLEEAAAYAQLLEDFGCTHEELAERIGRSRPQISNTLRLLRLPPLVQRRLAAGVLSAGHARALLALEDGAAMERLAQRVVAEGLSVRAVEEIITLGGGVGPARGRRAASPPPADLEARAAGLADRLDTRVKISMGRSKGRLTVDFAGLDDLDRILALLQGGRGAGQGADQG
ncbi:hypothetical protein NUM3379_28790 [Kineococcus sp. NUM-3379]